MLEKKTGSNQTSVDKNFSDHENVPEEVRLGVDQPEEEGLDSDEMGEEAGLDIIFYPPLYIQRYEKAVEFLLEERWVHAISRVVILIQWGSEQRTSE